MPSVLFLTSLAFFLQASSSGWGSCCAGSHIFNSHSVGPSFLSSLSFYHFFFLFLFSSLFFFNCFSFSFADILDGFAI